MKKLIVFSAALIIGLSAQSQFGVKGGLNLFNLMGDDVEDTKMLASIHAGVLYNIKVSKMFSVRPEAFYSGQGAKESDSDIRLKLGYLNIAPLLVLNTKPGLFFETGPQLGLLLSAKYKDDNTSIDVKDDLKGSDFGWLFGLGYNACQNFSIDVRFAMGLSTIGEDSDSDVKNIGLGVGVIYMFGIPKK